MKTKIIYLIEETKNDGEEEFAFQFTQNGAIQFHLNFRSSCPLKLYMISMVQAKGFHEGTGRCLALNA